VTSLRRLGTVAALLISLSSGCDLSPNIDLPSAEGDSAGDGDDSFTGDGDGVSLGDGDDSAGPTIKEMGGGSSTCPTRAGAGGAPDDCHD
jgi:hypothetical protein